MSTRLCCKLLSGAWLTVLMGIIITLVTRRHGVISNVTAQWPCSIPCLIRSALHNNAVKYRNMLCEYAKQGNLSL